MIEPYARGIGLTVVVVVQTYFSVVVGELVPKQLGLLAPEKTASLIAPTMDMLAHLAGPLVWLLSASSSSLLRLMGVARKDEPPVTDEEIKVLMEQGSEAGVFHESEQAIVSNVLRLDDQRISSIMTHRNDIYLLDLSEREEEIRNRIAESPYTRLVVCRDGLDHVIGILRTVDILKDARRQENHWQLSHPCVHRFTYLKECPPRIYWKIPPIPPEMCINCRRVW